jgi:hypothetical protein
MVRRLALVFFFILFSSTGYSQNPKVDSLESLLVSANGAERVKILQALVINLWLNHPDTAVRYAREAIKISKDLKDIKSQAISIRLLGGVQVYQGKYDSALFYSKKAHVLSVQSGDSTLISSTLNR